jgi:RimJ/RimL family protein N-acetyltransferase
VIEYLPAPLTRAESDALADRIATHFAQHNFGLWAVEIPDVSAFIGFIGLSTTDFKAPFTPCVEIGWRLAAAYWGQGYASEGAKAALAFGFETLQLSEIVSFTVPPNRRSRRVMEKIGLTHDPQDDFGHPLLPSDHPLHTHVLYRLRRQAWSAQ